MRTRYRPSPWHSRLAVLALLLAGGSAHADDRARAEAAAKDLGQRLRAALVAKMEAAGPVSAIDFCHDEAPSIAADHCKGRWAAPPVTAETFPVADCESGLDKADQYR